MTSPSPRPPWFLPLAATVVLAFVGGAFWLGRTTGSKGLARAPGASSVSGAPQTPVPFKLHAQKRAPAAMVWLDVYRPGAIRAALERNAWLQGVLGQPLGRGFLGSWAGFLGTRGEDLKAGFRGEVARFIVGQMLDQPLRVSWYGAGEGEGLPVVTVPHPSVSARAAFTSLDAVARRGEQGSDTCPGRADRSREPLVVGRWLIAEQSLFVGQRADRLVLAQKPDAVLDAMCDELPVLKGPEGTDGELALRTDRLDRDVQALVQAAGLGPEVRLGVAAQGDTLAPRGLLAELVRQGRLDAQPWSEQLLRAVPQQVPVALLLQLKLPASLDAATLKGFLAATAPPVARTRQVAILWLPRGKSPPGEPEVAVLWSDREDRMALGQLFRGRSLRPVAVACDGLVIASSEALEAAITKTCRKEGPSILDEAPPVVAGIRTRSSVQLNVKLGRLLAQLTRDGFGAEPAPPEIEAAAHLLEELPAVGFSGTAEDSRWTGGGFRS